MDDATHREAFADLMDALGYDRSGVQGGDWGARIGPDVGRRAPDRVLEVRVKRRLWASSR